MLSVHKSDAGGIYYDPQGEDHLLKRQEPGLVVVPPPLHPIHPNEAPSLASRALGGAGEQLRRRETYREPIERRLCFGHASCK